MNLSTRYCRFVLTLILFFFPVSSFTQENNEQENIDTKGAPPVTLIVTDPGDSGPDTLRQAVLDANPGDTIEFNLPGAAPHTITLTTGEIFIDKELTINGSGKTDLIISGNNNSRVFNISPPIAGTSVTIRELTIRDGDARVLSGLSPLDITTSGGGPPVSQKGGGIFNTASLTLEDCVMSNNTSGGDADGGGGALATRGAIVFIRRCHFLNNTDIDMTNDSFGGAIDMQPSNAIASGLGFLLIEDSKFDNNSSQAGSNSANGGALYISRGPFATAVPPANISTTSFTNNFAQAETANGGAVYSNSGALTLTNIVVLGNEADGSTAGTGGGFYNSQTASPTAILDLLNVTVSQNIARGFLARGGGLFYVGNGLNNPITNGTISENAVEAISGPGVPTGYGGAIFIDNSNVDLLASTVAFNEARGPDGSQLTGAGIFVGGSFPAIRYRNNLIVGNVFGNIGGASASFDISTKGAPLIPPLLIPNCVLDPNSGNTLAFQSNGTSNISDSNLADDRCNINFNADFDANTMLGPLEDNGGYTLTHALIDTMSPANPAIDGIPDGDCTNEVTPITRKMDDPFSPKQNKFYFADTFESYPFYGLSFQPLFIDYIETDHLARVDFSSNKITSLNRGYSLRAYNDSAKGYHVSNISDEIEVRGLPPMENVNDGRPFPRPYDWTNTGTALCDVGSFELQPEGIITIEKISNPPGGQRFQFDGTNFPVGCELEDVFSLNDGESATCIVPEGTFAVEETDDQGLPFLVIDCGQPTADVTIDTPNSIVSIEIINDGDEAFCTFLNSVNPILTVIHQGTGTGVSTSSPAGIDCPDDNCVQGFPGGTNVSLGAVADPGSVFDGWTGDCVNTASSMTSITLNANSTCIATFSLLPPVTLDVTILGSGEGGVLSTNPGIDCNSMGTMDCDESYTVGTGVTLTATPQSGSVFTGWSGDPECTGDPTNPILNLTMNADISCEATFDIEQVMLDVTVLGPGSGAVTSTNPGINCSNTGATDCDETYNIGTMVTLTAAAQAGSMFVMWGGDAECTGDPTNPVLSLTMNTDISCTAMFSLLPPPVTLDVTIQGNGDGGVESSTPGIDCSSTGANDCDETYMMGTMVTLTATPEPGSIFTGWSGDAECTGDPLNPVLNLTMNSDISCIATFILTVDPLVTLTVEIEGNGTGTVISQPPGIDCLGDCTEVVAPGTTFTLTATPGPNSTFVGWSEDCTGADSDFTITVNVDSLCVATFVLNEFVLNPIFPALDDNINFITAENATPDRNVAFTWSKATGSLKVGGRVCNGINLGLNNPRLLSIRRANEFGVATYIFYIPLFGDFEFQVQLQAVDISTCRTSNIVPQIIRKEEGG